jgi:hypothetical protein
MTRSQLPSGCRRASWTRPPVPSDGRVEGPISPAARALVARARRTFDP